MASGVGATTITNDPRAQGVKFMEDPAAFFELTERNVYTPLNQVANVGGSNLFEVPKTGVLSRVRLLFVGTLTTDDGSGSVDTSALWPHGLLKRLTLAMNAQTDLWTASGPALHAERVVRFPGRRANAGPDTWFNTPTLGAPGVTVTDGAHDLVLTYDVGIAIDDTSLVGSIYAQSPSTSLQLEVQNAAVADLIVTVGDATATIAGSWYVETESYDIPLGHVGDGNGAGGTALILPDMSRLHGVQEFPVPFSNTGEVRAPLIRTNGQLDRLLVKVVPGNLAGSDTAAPLDWSAQASEIESIRIEYGAGERPLSYDPAHFLAVLNVDHYGQQLPYGFSVFDFLWSNPQRDVIMMPGVTDLAVIPTIGSGVSVAAGAAVSFVQETLFR